MRKGIFLLSSLALSLIGCGVASPTGESSPRAADHEAVVIRCDAFCDTVAATIQRAGGRIGYRYHNIPALAATVPDQSLPSITALVGRQAVAKDLVVASPSPVERLRYRSTDSVTLQRLPHQTVPLYIAAQPQTYLYNARLTNTEALLAQGHVGEGVVVAVIDTGTANNAELVPVLTSTVIGGENLVEGGEEPSATSTLNDPHGTWIGSLIAAHALLVLPNSDELVQSLAVHSPDSLMPLNENDSLVPMLGTAPGANIYAFKVFPADGSGAPSSRVLAAMDRIVTLKLNYEAGQEVAPVAGDGSEDDPFVYEALNIQVVNLSLGGPTLFAGHELEDLMTEAMLEAGITVVTAAGNDGFAAMTAESPGTGRGALAVGAANSAVHERVMRDLQLGPGHGVIYRPTDHLQTAIFSARGPTPGGRVKPDIIANGFGSFVQSADGSLAFVSGTSMSAPTVAGAAALLQAAFPGVSAKAVRGALMAAANDEILGDGSGPMDQGRGFLDVAKAYELLGELGVEDDDEDDGDNEQSSESDKRVAKNLERFDIEIIAPDEDGFSEEVNLVPGQVAQFYIATDARTRSLTVRVEDIEPELPPERQNQLFTDDVVLTVVDAPTSFAATRVEEFLVDDASFDIVHPQQGLVRVALMGDWTNAGKVSARLVVTRQRERLPEPAFTGRLADAQVDTYTIPVEAGQAEIDLNLRWRYGWDYYPTHDLDLILIDPEGNPIFDGATLAVPERVVIPEPIPGEWTVMVDGFALHGLEDRYELRVTGVDIGLEEEREFRE